MTCVWIRGNVFAIIYSNSKFAEKIVSEIITSLKTQIKQKQINFNFGIFKYLP